MRICHVITRLILGGAQENTLLTCEGLHARGHEVTLVTGPAQGPEGELMTRARAGGYRVIELPAMRREINPLRDWQAYRALRRLFRENHFQIMHSHSSKAGILAREAAATVGRMKVVHTIHGLPFHPYANALTNWVYVALERRAARVSQAIVSVADAMTRQALAAGVGRPEQYTTIRSGMEVEGFLRRPAEADDFRRSLQLPPEAVLVTQVSRLAELKGHEYILEAARGLSDSRVHFCFVGDGWLRQWIQQRMGELGLAHRVHLTGLVGPEKIPAIMHATDILVHCSLREGLARTIPQAMLAGKPVISYDVDGAREVVDDSTGVLLPPRETLALRESIVRLAGNPALRQRLGEAGRRRCQELFDHGRMVEQIEQVYRRIL